MKSRTFQTSKFAVLGRKSVRKFLRFQRFQVEFQWKFYCCWVYGCNALKDTMISKFNLNFGCLEFCIWNFKVRILNSDLNFDFKVLVLQIEYWIWNLGSLKFEFSILRLRTFKVYVWIFKVRTLDLDFCVSGFELWICQIRNFNLKSSKFEFRNWNYDVLKFDFWWNLEFSVLEF